MPKQIKHWMGLVWKKCPVSNAYLCIGIIPLKGGADNDINKPIRAVYFWSSLLLLAVELRDLSQDEKIFVLFSTNQQKR